MEEKLLFSTFLQDIKEKENFSNATLARYMNCSEGAVSLYLSKKSLVGYDKIVALRESLKNIEYKDIYTYIFDHFPVGFYHGSRQGIDGNIDPDRNKNKTLDFGHGFYLGTTFKQSSTFVAAEDGGKDRVYKFSFSLEGLDYLELRDIRWVFFVAYNRKKIPDIPENAFLLRRIRKVINHGYDVIVGPIADDKMAISMDNFFNNNISYGQLIKCLAQLSIGDQYCLKTQKACNNLTCEVIYICQDDGIRKLIREYAFEAIQSASKHAEAINKQSDNGKKFSELLKEYANKSLF
ncbi:MAG: DUF3990 domain-containing protein [Bacilli bacterium]|nr:DUF3990 domain-containing protein [Bacilli bacterium]